MESEKNGKKVKGGSTTSSNLAVELFGPKDVLPPSSSKSPFAALFAPPSTGGSINPAGAQWRRHEAQLKEQGENYYGEKGEYENVASDSSEYFTSSIYYGGRETYSPRTPPVYSQPPPYYKKEEGEEEPEKATRGNWWQGSLYY